MLLTLMSISKLGLGNQILSDTSKVDSLKMELRLQVERVEKEKQYNFRNTKLFQAQCLCQSATEDGFFDQVEQNQQNERRKYWKFRYTHRNR